MKAIPDPAGALPHARRHRRQQFEPPRAQSRAQAEIGRGTRQAGEGQGFRLHRRQPGQLRPVAVEQAEAAAGAAIGIDRYAGGAEMIDIPLDRPQGDLELGGQDIGRQPPPELEQDEHR
jgi:hypothetical protein